MSVRTLLIIVGIIVAVGGGYVAWRKLSKVTVSVVNGFDIPIKARIGGKQVVVPANQHVSVRVRCRPCQVVVTTESGVMIDRAKLDPSGEHVVFNPLGASTMANVGEMYNVHGLTSLEPKPSIEYFFERIIEPTGADYYFDAPQMIPKGDAKGTIEIRIFEQRMGWEATMLGSSSVASERRRRSSTKRWFLSKARARRLRARRVISNTAVASRTCTLRPTVITSNSRRPITERGSYCSIASGDRAARRTSRSRSRASRRARTSA